MAAGGCYNPVSAYVRWKTPWVTRSRAVVGLRRRAFEKAPKHSGVRLPVAIAAQSNTDVSSLY